MGKEHFYTLIKQTLAGDLLVIGSEKGIRRIEMNVKSPERHLAEFEKKYGFRPEPGPSHLADAVRQLKEYFKGRRESFDLKLDLSGVTPFRKKVYQALDRVKFGETSSYGELAQKSGGLKYSRAIGSAMASNPLPIVIPCHRVVRSDGGLGGYGGGLPLKKRLLGLEGAKV